MPSAWPIQCGVQILAGIGGVGGGEDLNIYSTLYKAKTKQRNEYHAFVLSFDLQKHSHPMSVSVMCIHLITDVAKQKQKGGEP
jgi:hypothetical protein